MSGTIPTSDDDVTKKSAKVAYRFWFFLGMFGAHRFYLGQSGTGMTILNLTICSIIFMFFGIGFLLILIPLTWVIVDFFLIPDITKRYNRELAQNLSQETRQ